MKLAIVAVIALVAFASAGTGDLYKSLAGTAEDHHNRFVQIVRSNFDQSPEGAYQYGFEADNGISRNEKGELKTVNDEDNKPRNVVVMRGSYQYIDETGKPVTVNYYADETGFHAESDIIPKPFARR